MSIRFVLILLLSAFMACGVDNAHAGRALFLARDIHQWLDFDYRYDYSASDSGGNNMSNSSTYLENTYHFDTTYALLRPKLLMGTLAVDLGFDGQWQKSDIQGSDIGTNPTLQYRLDGTFLKDENYPVNFNSYYEKDYISRVFTRSYNVDSRGEGVGFNYRNSFLPTQLTYSQSENTTSGLTNDRTGKSKNIGLNSTHRYNNLSVTNFNMMSGQFESASSMQTGQDVTTDITSLVGSNNLSFTTSDLRRYLDSQYSYSDSSSEYGDDGDRVEDWNTNSIWTERLYWQLGSALHSGLDYRNSTFESQRNQQQTQAGNGWLRHRLFDNFTTNFGMGTRETTFLRGTESGWTGDLDFNYTKLLPQGCNMSLGLNNSYGVTERNLESGILSVFDQSFLYDATQFNYLDTYDILIDTIVIRSQDRTQIYDEGADYTLEQIGRQIWIDIPDGSRITDGDILSIDYDYTTNPDIKYASKARAVSASVGLFDNSYRLGGQVSESSEELLEGDDSNVSLTDSTGYMLSLEKNITYFTLKGEYTAKESTTEKYHTWEPSVAYSQYFNQYFLSARLRARQTEYEEVFYKGTTSRAGSEKSLSAQVRLRQRLLWLPGATWDNRVDCRQLEGLGNERTEVDVNSALQFFLGRSRIRLEGDVSWEDIKGRQSQEASLWLKFRRIF